ncbi:ectonucleoside triphosphate diphosphohydrolase 4 [Paragonimus westermani]|uniref:Ectonucleoside triphosphate diphosphohydrolase 4 n=1 Tax=Paragonimus westermani TaxID=34504 RepID=A0A5J4NLH0_9TREM|nr:ectonucleoside triphosphate diphosphohydrolase 4 [Paragonimus westermani]
MWLKDYPKFTVQKWVVIFVTFPFITTFAVPVRSGFNVDKNFAIVIDAGMGLQIYLPNTLGSSGSRMYVYTWLKDLSKSHGIPNLELLKDKSGSSVIKKVTPGLSEFSDNLDNITTYIPQLLDYATQEIPKVSHRSTPLFILATAGMRLLTEEQQAKIWNRVQVLVKSKYNFKFENSYAVTITGNQEALYGWIAVNYLTGRFLHGLEDLNRKSTYGMLDMGGASMQIAYELDSDEGVPCNLVTSFTLKGSTPDLYKKYNVYVVSYLNYGANVIRTKYEQISLHSALKKMHPKPKNSSIFINDSCLSRGKEIVQTLVPRDIDDFRIPDKTEHTYQVHFQGTGNFEECINLIKPLFHKRNDCAPIPCAIGNTVQPLFNTHQMAFFGLTEYNYSMTDILSSEIYSYDEAVRQAKILCAKPWDEYVDYLRKKHSNKTEKEFQDLLEWKKYVCFKAPFVISTLHTGLNFPLDYKNLRVVIDLDDIEVQWNWGALFYMLK